MRRPAALPLAATLAGITLVGVSAIAHPRPRLVWNASASVAVGLYRAVSGAPERGDFILVRIPKSIESLAAGRGYLPAGIPLIKRVAAVARDDVCAFDGAVIVNGEIVARQRKVDRAGRSLPRWNECRELVQGEFFLLGDAPDSFDSRYFGPVTSARAIGRLVPLWADRVLYRCSRAQADSCRTGRFLRRPAGEFPIESRPVSGSFSPSRRRKTTPWKTKNLS